MIDLVRVKENIYDYYNQYLSIYVGYYSLVRDVEDLGLFYDFFSRHANILDGLRLEICDFSDELDLGIEYPFVFEGNEDYILVLNEYVERIKDISKYLNSSCDDLEVAAKCLSMITDFNEANGSEVFLFKDEENFNTYNAEELYFKLNATSKLNYNGFYKSQYVKKIEKGEKYE